MLVAIANYGTKNRRFLDRLLREYRSMTRYDVHPVVLSNIPKDLGPDVEVIVGLPAKNPRSLPFGYKRVFTDRVEQYNLFVYSEDDTLITEENIDAFLEVTDVLPENYVAGFLRYEVGDDGTKYYSTLHGHYHWDPNSVFRVGEYVFAHYTNEHAACFILTQAQLKRAIQGGGFLLPPRDGRYGMLETAATDPYTQCQMKKMICISHLDDFCLHHLPNAYLGRIGVESETATREIGKLLSLAGTCGVRGPLFDNRPLVDGDLGSKRYYEPARNDILSIVPKNVRRILSIGCASGATEGELIRQGIDVVGIPMDCVVGVTAEAHGVKLLPPSLDAARGGLKGDKFDCLLFADVLQHLPDPIGRICQFLDLLIAGGTIVISVPNLDHYAVLKRRLTNRFKSSAPPGTDGFEKYRLHITNRRRLRRWLRACGLGPEVWSYAARSSRLRLLQGLRIPGTNALFCMQLVVRARRLDSPRAVL